MENIRPATDLEKNVFEYLNDLRESGITNMFGATPYVADAFDMDRDEARKLLSLWMKNFSVEGNYEMIKP